MPMIIRYPKVNISGSQPTNVLNISVNGNSGTPIDATLISTNGRYVGSIKNNKIDNNEDSNNNSLFKKLKEPTCPSTTM